ncbi:MAG TPA: MupA/Atu3671 family FMN-dependent luciferase-like monooxygenase [Dehalococcoidia bacterium]|nr:MupA/Atu3671 family FMN-dependent luciferase-like monooxygenase [Dehalococcoidia bacterium]
MVLGPSQTGKKKLSAAFIGDNSLLVECAEIFRRAGHSVSAVVSSDPQIEQWADELKLDRMHPSAKDLHSFLSERPFDVLISIANQSAIPPDVVKLARESAIAFHDSLLPKYPGEFATSRAIVNREQMHGVTWHELAGETQTCRIIKQEAFDVGPDETAFSLNAKCYQAGISSFADLISGLESGPLTLAAPALERLGEGKRIEAAGLIDWECPAEDIEALVQALDFGPYANPLARAKFASGGQTVIVSGAEVLTSRSGAAPGTVVAINEDAIIVSTASSDLSLSGLQTLEGAALSVAQLGLRRGDRLPRLEEAVAERLTQLATSVATHEEFWTGRLLAIEPISLPFAGRPERESEVVYQRASFARPARGLDLVASASAGASLAAAFACYLSRLAGTPRFSLGLSSSGLSGKLAGAGALFADQVPVSLEVSSQASVAENLSAVVSQLHATQEHRTYARDLISRQPKLRVAFGGKAPSYSVAVELAESLDDYRAHPGNELVLVATAERESAWYFDSAVFSADRIATMQAQFAVFLDALVENETAQLGSIPLLADAERRQLEQWNQTAVEITGPRCINELFEAQVQRSPEAPALGFRDQVLPYDELNRKTNRLARRLMALGVGPEQLVGISTDRSPDMVIAMLAVLKAGGGYLPLDSAYPADRLNFIAEDSDIKVLLTQKPLEGKIEAGGLEVVLLDDSAAAAEYPDTNPRSGVGPTNVAYTIYTSGSTGRPKGVIIEHRTVVNFFAGMDAKLRHDPPGVWLAVTSPSFDISVLELLWTLCRGFKVVLYEREDISAAVSTPSVERRHLDFSLFYFGSHGSDDKTDPYQLLLESAKFADEHGWAAVWTPERHFHAFGGAFPNPSVLGAALAVSTKQIAIRAGSNVLPLHSPIRVAEEWSVVDNLSHGRVGVSFASGWQPNDFVFKPENFTKAKEVMTRDIDVVRRLWRGETVQFPRYDGEQIDISILPRPVQPELPIWLTAAGSPETFALAGRMGASILTHLLGQSFDEVATKVLVYREAWKAAGHAGEGHVTLMLHTFVGDDEAAVRDAVREPLKAYLGTSLSLIKDVAWAFPTFQHRLSSGETIEDSFAALSEEEMDALLEVAFNRYFETSGLFGRPERCLQTLEKVASIGVDEVACMADFGLGAEEVMRGLERLERVRQTWNAPAEEPKQAATIPALIRAHNATHMQCTPSMASALLMDEDSEALGLLNQMLVGGEALPSPLAKGLLGVLKGDLINMYGPTETTIWSTCHVVGEGDDPVPIGKPIANTRVYVLDDARQPVPVGSIGELYIGGDGVARGYLDRPELTAERFVADPFSPLPDARLYRTGDLARYKPDGDLEFLGRTDFQVKIRGHRIELGEIESQLLSHPDVREVVLVASEVSAGDQRLVAYWSAVPGAAPSTETLRQYCRDHLPDYMTPHHFVKIAALPQTPNGKVDRKALPDFTSEAESEPAAEVKPEGELEETIAGIWKDVLKTPSVSVTTNFFDLGGHSLLALQMHRRLVESVQPSLLLTDIFRFPTIRAMTQFIAARDGGADEDGRVAAERASRRREALSQRLRRRG